MAIEFRGEYTTARVLVDNESLVEDDCLEQIQTLIDHPAFTEPVRIMPDTHPGAGAHETGSLEAFEAAMEGVYSESVVESVIDEAPMACKSAEAIVAAIEPTAEVRDWLDVVHNLKARD